MIEITYDKEKNNFILNPNGFQNNEKIRALPNRRWSNKEQYWIAPAIKLNAISIKAMGASLSTECETVIGQLSESKSISKPFPKEFKFKLPPYDHQKEALDRSYSKNFFGFFMEMGTGKTKTVIDLISNYYIENEIDTVIIFSPKSVKTTWVKEIETHSNCEVSIVFIDSKDRKIPKIYTPSKLTYYIMGIESLSQKKKGGRFYEYSKEVLGSSPNTCIVIDEVHAIKTHSSTRTLNALELGKLSKYRFALTGTPITQGLLDLFPVFQFLDANIIGAGSFYSFRNRYAVLGGYQNKQIVGYKNSEELLQLIKPWVYQVKKEDCLDLPDKIYIRREVELSTEQSKIYKALKKDSAYLFTESNTHVLCKNVLQLYLRLQQIVSGFIVKDSIEPVLDIKPTLEGIVPVDKNPKIKELINIIESNPGKSIIIWCKFIWEVHEISMVLNDKFGAVSMFYGDLSTSEREDSKNAFLEKQTQFFVATQQSGGTGITLNVSDLVVYFSNTFKYSDRMQSEDRCHRIGQTKHVTYIDLIAVDTVDERILNALKSKKNISDYVYDMLGEGSELC